MTRLATPLFGLDATSEVSPAAQHSVGSSFIERYVSRYSWKVLTRQEVLDYQAHGIHLGVVFEDGAQNALAGYDAGKADAEFAHNQARSLGMPSRRPIFFAVDYDPAGNAAATDAYFDGVAAVLSRDLSGPYGGIEVVRRQLDRGFKFAWQTYAWSGGQLDSRAQVYQYSNGHTVGGQDTDFNHAYYDDYGQWDFQPVDPDPHHYLWFPTGPFSWIDKGKRIQLHERATVQAYDVARQHPIRNARQLRALKHTLFLLAQRVSFEAHQNLHVGGKTIPPTWSLDRRGFRWQELYHRSLGQKIV